MESKYNLLTRLLKNIKNVVNPDGSIAGGGSGVLVVHVINDATTGDLVLDKTYQEIEDSGFCVLHYVQEVGDDVRTHMSALSALVVGGSGQYAVNFENNGGTVFLASSRTDHPRYHDGK